MATTHYKVMNAFDSLHQGDVYQATAGKRMVFFLNTRTGKGFSIYPHQIAQALASGALKEVSGSVCEAMLCPAGDALTKRTAQGFAY